MVVKLKNNLEYVTYIRESVNKQFCSWDELSVKYEGEINNNFQITFTFLDDRISFVKDRECLELVIYNDDNLVPLGYLLYNLVRIYIPSQDEKWRLSICVELIDCYIYFLKLYYTEMKLPFQREGAHSL